MKGSLYILVVAAVCSSSPCWAIDGSSLALNSGGTSGASAVLDNNGYVGTYIHLDSPGSVTVTVGASGTAAGGVDPRMNIVIADKAQGFDVAAGSTNYEHTFDLPAGTHFVRTEFANDGGTGRALTIGSLNVSGATLVNNNNDSNALAAAETYVQNYRKGPAEVALLGAAPGTEVQVKLKRHAFGFGTNVHGGSDTGLLDADPSPGTNAYNYQQFVNEHFNVVEPSNAGKWSFNEPFRDNVSASSMAWVDKIFQYAEDHDMRARQHTLIWGDQQPYWVNNLINDAGSGNPTAISGLRDEISERIDYYVGDGDANPDDGDRARDYVELDVYNESVHTGVNRDPSYWSIYGASGISDIFDEVAQAVSAAGANTKLFLNEYNILQHGYDEYGNWYREHLEDIENADGDPFDQTVSGIGMQLYGLDGHSASYMQQVLQNMSVTGLPLTLTEFGVQSSVTDEAAILQIVEDSIRMMFGTPNANAFLYWGWWASATSGLQSASVMVDSGWNLTAAGELYEDLLGIQDWDGDPSNGWTTDLTLSVNPDGTIDFTGFYGDYEITIGGETFDLELLKGTTDYELTVGPVLLGDYNSDGVVDAGDYTVWRDALAAGATSLPNEGASPGVVDEADYLFWHSQFGQTLGSGAGATTAVPEPAGLMLLLIGAALGAWRRLALGRIACHSCVA